MSAEYRALVAKVSAFTAAASSRRHADLACGPGCASCCQAWLRVSAVEAAEIRHALAELPAAERAEVRERGRRELAREAACDEGAPRDGDPPRCALLDERGRCAVYDARPLVCRTQGHALRYPHGFIPAEAVRRKHGQGEVTWCPLNYRQADPAAEDVLDAERVDQILAVVAARHAHTHDVAADERLALSMLAAEKDVLHEQAAREHEPEHTRTPASDSERRRADRERDDTSERQDPTRRDPARGR